MSDPIETTYPIYNQYIYKDGIGWVLVGGGGGGGDSLPDQTNNAGKFLTTDGSVASWGAVTPASIGALPDDTTAADIGAIPDTHPIMPITQADINKWNDSDVFITTYGTTTYADTLAAYNAGKLVVAKNGANYVPLSEYDTTNNRLRFYYWDLNQPNWWNLTSSGWGNGAGTAYVPQNRTINTKDLSTNITLSASDVGAIPENHIVSGITQVDINNWNAKADTDTKVTQTPVNGENATKALLVGSLTEITSTINSVPNITYNDSSKTLGIAGTSNEKDLIINGESIKFRTINGNFQGALKSATLTADRTYTLQDASGTLAFTSDIPSSLSEFTNDPGFITTPNIPYLTCGTAVGTAAKTTTLVSGSFGPTDLVTGAQVLVKFTNSNTAGSATLNVNGTGAKPLRRYGNSSPGTSNISSWQAGAIVLFIYDGSAWVMENWQNTTYSTMTEAEATDGASTLSRLVTPALLKKAIQTWAIPESHVVNGITQNDIDAWDAKVSDDHKWNDVTLNHTTISSNTIYIPGMAASNSTSAYLFTAKTDPTALSASLYDSNGYLHSTTPSANDTSNKVATTDFVSSALSAIEGVPSYGASDTGKVLKTDGVSAYWASIDSLLEYKGVKATAAALPTTGNTTGDVWIVEEDNSEYVWNGTTWEKFGPTIDLSGYVPTSRKVNNKALSTDITLSASDVSALPDTTDVTRWNGVALDKGFSPSSQDFYVPFLSATTGTRAALALATNSPAANRIAKYDANRYLNSTTPSADDSSTKVATTAFVGNAISSLGSILNYKGTKTTVAELPATGNQTGDVWIVTADNSEHVWNGSAWEKFGPTIDLSGYVPTSRTVNGKALSNDITLTASDVGAIPDSHVANGITAADISNWNNKPRVDELVKQVPLTNADGFKSILFASTQGGLETTATAYKSEHLMFIESSTPQITLYNNGGTKYSSWSFNELTLQSNNNSYRGSIQANTSLTASATYTLPNTSGTLALTSQIPTSLAELTNDPGYAIITIRDWTSAS